MRRATSLFLLLLLAAFAWWSAEPQDEGPPATSSPAGPQPAGGDPAPPVVPVTATAATGGRDTGERDEVQLGEPSAELSHDDLLCPYEHELRLAVVDEFGLPVAGAALFVAVRGCGFSQWPDATDALGRLTVRLQSRVSQLDLLVGLFTAGRPQPMRWVSLGADRPHAVALVVHGEPQVSTVDKAAVVRRLRAGTMPRASKPRRRDELDIECGRTQLLFREFDCRNCHEPSLVREFEPYNRAGLAVPGLHPCAVLQDRHRQQRVEPGSADAAAAEAAAAAPPAAAPPDTSSAVGWVSGTVRGIDGAAVGEVPVVWLGRDGSVQQRCRTDAEGHFRLQPMPVGVWQVVAGGGSHGVAAEQVAVLRAHGTDQDFLLRREQTVRGVATGEDGGVLVGWRVELERAEGDWAGFTTTARDGSFVFAGVPGLGLCLLWPHDRECRLPVLYDQVGLVDGQVVHAALSADRPTRARLVLHPALPAGTRRDAVMARATQLESGRAATMIATALDDAFELTGLPPGAYRVEVGAPGLGWVDAAPAQIDGRGLWDLLRVAVPAAGRLRVVAAGRSPLQGEHALLRRLPQLDVYEDAEPLAGGALGLPAGDHLLLWREDGLRAIAFHIAPGEETVVSIAPR